MRKARGDREVYTPQVVVNGAVHVLGSDKAAIEQRDRADARAELGTLLAAGHAVEQAGDKLTVTVPAAKDENGQAEVWLCPITKIGAGGDRPRREQRPHRHLHNVVRRWVKLGDWTGKARRRSTCRCSDVHRRGVDAVAVVVQAGSQGSARAACSARRRSRRCADAPRSSPNDAQKKGPA